MNILIAGTETGCGKTTVAVGIMAALRRRGIDVRGYKVGPDYIDPMLHRLATGAPSINLDPWMCGSAYVKRAVRGPMAVIEGVMGLFDGSTAQVAQLLKAPVILVINAWTTGRSAAALVKGFREYDRNVRIAGVIANRVAGPGHERILRDAVPDLVGALPMDPRLAVPERHLGLRMPSRSWLAHLAKEVETHIDLDRLVRIAGSASHKNEPVIRRRGTVPIGIAEDEAFNFYYSDNLSLLEEAGARLVRFSPLRSSMPRVAAVYLGGGFPEEHARGLARNRALVRALRESIRAGLPVYAECGGLMYLSDRLTDQSGRSYSMVGAVPGRIRMQDRLQHFGYSRAQALCDGLVLRRGESVRGHEFHHSDRIGPADLFRVTKLSGESRREGYASTNVHASYVHVHFASAPQIPRRFVRAAALFFRIPA
jgi:cobyrinic acid a,c-diamide synthase